MNFKLPDKSLREVLRWASSFLQSEGREASTAEWLLRERFNLTKLDLFTKGNEKLPEEVHRQFEGDLKCYLEGYPPQYIVGHTWFYGRKFLVNKHVLIPRPETEELVAHAVDHLPDRPLKIVDIGTGSGIIAVTLEKERPADEVWATDISEESLQVAQKNAERLDAQITFVQGDLLVPLEGQTFDVVISNPPYISYDEEEVMGEDVLKHEPHLALFAENHGLAIYQRLSEEMPKVLAADGCFFFEIGYQQGEAVRQIFQEAFPGHTVSSVKDLTGNDRFIIGYKN